MIQLKKILHPTDFSDPSNQALNYAQALCARFEAELHVVHVLPSAPAMAAVPLGTGAGLVSPQLASSPDEDRQQAEEQLSTLVTPEWAVEHSVHHATAEGPPFIGIIEYAREHAIDLIVLGTHGRSGLKQMLIGSVAEKVVRKAPCPVLTVRPEGHQFVMP